MTGLSISLGRVRCPACDTEQEARLPGGRDECVMCGALLTFPPPVLTPEPSAPSPIDVSPSTAPEDAAAHPEVAIQLKHLLSTIREVEVPAFEAPKLKAWWLAIPAGLILVVLLLGSLVFEPPAEQDPAARDRVEHDVNLLAGLVERYHAEAGRYPDAAAWRKSAQVGGDRFLDPWRHVYVYRLDSTVFSIASYGADGETGGSGANADLAFFFPLQKTSEAAPTQSKPTLEDRAK